MSKNRTLLDIMFINNTLTRPGQIVVVSSLREPHFNLKINITFIKSNCSGFCDTRSLGLVKLNGFGIIFCTMGEFIWIKCNMHLGILMFWIGIKTFLWLLHFKMCLILKFTKYYYKLTSCSILRMFASIIKITIICVHYKNIFYLRISY